ncbi:MAG TPA: diguanylate cyclase [Kofleriaceae bacterium]|nr:diguanylate cyclase [Kofleriaceae bacterium]
MQPSDRILVVDDDAVSLDAVAELLRQHGHAVETADSGTEALASVEREAPALVLSDVRMPCVNGLTLVQTLRERSATAYIPIILMSAMTSRDGRLAGLEAGADDYLGKPIDPDELLLKVAAALRRLHHQRELERRSMIDPLTGVLNRRGFTAELRREHARALREPTPLSVLVIDVDRFKRLNDEYGHQLGDTALRQVARLLGDELRTADLIGRLGGDEFGVILGGADARIAAAVADRLRQCRMARLVVPGGTELAVSISVGHATLASGESIDALVDRADRDMYRHKKR